MQKVIDESGQTHLFPDDATPAQMTEAMHDFSKGGNREPTEEPGLQEAVWPTIRNAAVPAALGLAAGAIPGGGALPSIYQAVAGYLGRKYNVGAGYEEPGLSGDIASAAIPGAITGAGTIWNALKGGGQNIANEMLRFQTPEQQAVNKVNLAEQFGKQKAEVEAGDAVAKANLHGDWVNQQQAYKTTVRQEQRAVIDAQRAQYEQAKSAYQGAKTAYGENALATAEQLLQQDRPPLPASQMYATLDKVNTPVKLNNLRASQEKFGSYAEAKAQALGFQPNPAIERISPTIEIEGSVVPMTGEQRDAALRANVEEFMNYKAQGGQLQFIQDYNKMKQQVAAQEAVLGASQTAPANVLMSGIQETNRLIRQARNAGNGQLEGTLRQHQAAMWDDLNEFPGLSADFKAAQMAKRREFADEDTRDMILSSTRIPKDEPGMPLTEQLDVHSLLEKMMKMRTDRLYEGSYPEGYLNRFVSTMKQIGRDRPATPVAPEPPQFAPLGFQEAPDLIPSGPLQAPEMIPAPSKGSGTLKVFASSLGGAMGLAAGSAMGHPYLGFGAGSSAGYKGLNWALGKIAQSPAAQEMLIKVSKAGDNRISQEALANLAAFADSERARESGNQKVEIEQISPAKDSINPRSGTPRPNDTFR